VEDPEAALGLAIVSKGTNEMPMAVAVFDSINWKEPVHNSVQSKDVPGKGYHFYRSGKFSLSERTYVFLTDKWVPKVFMYMLYDPANPEQEWEAWASVKFTGPAYPYGDPKETNALYIDRVILTKVDSRDNTSRK